MQWPEKLEIYCDIYGTRGWERGPEALNEAEMTLYCVRPFQFEMSNGCFWAFLYNSSGDFASETVHALRRIRADTSASLLSEAIQIYFRGLPVPCDVHERRRRLLKEIDGDHAAEADRVCHDYYEVDEPFDDLLLAYAQANEAQFRLTEDEAATAQTLEGDWRQCTKCWDAWEQPQDETLARCPACQALTLLRDVRPSGAA